MKYCYSCSMPLNADVKAHGDFCQYCADGSGNLHPREQVKEGVKTWLKSWGPPAAEAEFEKRAEAFLAAMPAWQ